MFKFGLFGGDVRAILGHVQRTDLTKARPSSSLVFLFIIDANCNFDAGTFSECIIFHGGAKEHRGTLSTRKIICRNMFFRNTHTHAGNPLRTGQDTPKDWKHQRLCLTIYYDFLSVSQFVQRQTANTNDKITFL